MRKFSTQVNIPSVMTRRFGPLTTLPFAILIIVSAIDAATVRGQACEMNEASKHLASDGARFDKFGSSAAMSGDLAVIGAKGDTTMGRTSVGAAYVFRRTGDPAVWDEEAKLAAIDGAEFDRFGTAAAAGNNVVVVGANQAGNGGPGAAYVYRFGSVGEFWVEEQKLTASDGQPGDEFGISVAYSNEVVLVGAWRHAANGVSGTGAAYVFRFNTLTGLWEEEAELVPADVAQNDAFGFSVALSGDVAVVGARADDDQGNFAGTAFAFRYDSGTGQWNEEQKLLGSTVVTLDEFGTTVAVSGDVAMVAAQQFNSAGPGTVWVFRYDSGTGMWNEEDILTGSGSQTQDLFGFSIGLPTSGGTPTDAVFGARADDVLGPGTQDGAVYWFAYNGSNWVEQARFVASDNQGLGGNWLGNSVATDAGRAFAGAINDDENNTQSGSAYEFELAGGCHGDLNCDGAVNTGDVPAFALALVDPVGYGNAFPGCNILGADFTGDGAVSGLDVGGFVGALIAP